MSGRHRIERRLITIGDQPCVQIVDIDPPLRPDEVEIDLTDLAPAQGPMAPVLRPTPELAALQDLVACSAGGRRG